MTDTAPINVPEEIRVNGKAVLNANGSLTIAFNNLTGLNFVGSREHQSYLAYMRTVLDLPELDTSASLSFHVNGAEVATARCGDPQATRVTTAMIHGAMRQQLDALQAEAEALEMQISMGQELDTDDKRLAEIEKIRGSNPYMLHPDHGTVLKSVVQAEEGLAEY